MISLLPSGNYEVTPAWLKERYEYELDITDRLRRCNEFAGKEF
jgi:hypothetical protein